MPAGGRLVPHPRGEIERRATERESDPDSYRRFPTVSGWRKQGWASSQGLVCTEAPLFPSSSSFHGFIYFAFYLRLAAPSCPLFLFPVHAYTSPPTCQRAFCCSFQAVGGCKRGWLHGEERPRGHVELESLGPSHDPTTDGSIQRIRGLLENRDFVSRVGRFVWFVFDR